ncbi:DUF2971 domain-containing protein [Seonamhaeicola marinus]|uniref:DUF2971 domain-containing protein n=1 Tax=Seonamhaeicola marinus TaxID=1912246 RepID=A0A5D0I5L3_9FLAO|nr:DUF2971 domain-containing protein [Seonamhaeicola marinus]TYA78668.1 DUF2971 domain-containing protein [Seonamhaeicola marinus]
MRLYRYRKVNIFLTTEILKDELYLWSLNQQNDPNEGRLLFENNLNKQALFESLKNTRNLINTGKVKWKDWLISEKEKQYYNDIQNSSDSELGILAEKSLLRGDYDEKGIQLIKDRYKKMTDNLVMACFSTKKNCPVMFAHYADNHSGVCLEYEVDIRDFFKVNYVENYPKLQIFNPDQNLIIKNRMLTKHKDWEYESEYRLILYNRQPGIYTNKRILLKSVYFGINCTEATRKQIKTIAAQKKDKPKLYSVNVNDNTFEMQYNTY